MPKRKTDSTQPLMPIAPYYGPAIEEAVRLRIVPYDAKVWTAFHFFRFKTHDSIERLFSIFESLLFDTVSIVLGKDTIDSQTLAHWSINGMLQSKIDEYLIPSRRCKKLFNASLLEKVTEDCFYVRNNSHRKKQAQDCFSCDNCRRRSLNAQLAHFLPKVWEEYRLSYSLLAKLLATLELSESPQIARWKEKAQIAIKLTVLDYCWNLRFFEWFAKSFQNELIDGRGQVLQSAHTTRAFCVATVGAALQARQHLHDSEVEALQSNEDEQDKEEYWFLYDLTVFLEGGPTNVAPSQYRLKYALTFATDWRYVLPDPRFTPSLEQYGFGGLPRLHEKDSNWAYGNLRQVYLKAFEKRGPSKIYEALCHQKLPEELRKVCAENSLPISKQTEELLTMIDEGNQVMSGVSSRSVDAFGGSGSWRRT